MADNEGNVTNDKEEKNCTFDSAETATLPSTNSNDKNTDAYPNLNDVLHVLNEIKSDMQTDPHDAARVEILEQTMQILEHESIGLSTSAVKKSKDVDSESQKLKDTSSNRKNEEKLNMVMAEYEKAIAKLVHDNADIQRERDTFQVHLANVEAAFSDVHQKYERCKVIIEGFKTNETILKDTIRANEEQIVKQNNKYEALKTHAMNQLEKANSELAEIRKQYEDEVTRLEAKTQKLELKNNSLSSTLEQQIKENHELARICDNLIAKVGR